MKVGGIKFLSSNGVDFDVECLCIKVGQSYSSVDNCYRKLRYKQGVCCRKNGKKCRNNGQYYSGNALVVDVEYSLHKVKCTFILTRFILSK